LQREPSGVSTAFARSLRRARAREVLNIQKMLILKYRASYRVFAPCQIDHGVARKRTEFFPDLLTPEGQVKTKAFASDQAALVDAEKRNRKRSAQ
jgi:hypothetical protein